MAFRVLTGEIAHETNTFSVVPTTMENFRKRVFLPANEIPAHRRGTRSEFGATFEPLAREVITVDGGGLGSMILRKMAYKKTRRPIWPLDPVA